MCAYGDSPIHKGQQHSYISNPVPQGFPHKKHTINLHWSTFTNQSTNKKVPIFPFQTTNRSTINLQQSTIGSDPFHSKQTDFISWSELYPTDLRPARVSTIHDGFGPQLFGGGGQRPLICDLKNTMLATNFLVLGKSGSHKKGKVNLPKI